MRILATVTVSAALAMLIFGGYGADKASYVRANAEAKEQVPVYPGARVVAVQYAGGVDPANDHTPWGNTIVAWDTV